MTLKIRNIEPPAKTRLQLCPGCRGQRTVNVTCPNGRCMDCVPEYSNVHRDPCPECGGEGWVPAKVG